MKVFNDQGRFVRTIGRAGTEGPGALNYPTDVDVAADGRVLVADAYNYRVQIFSQEGKPLAAHGRQVRRPDGGIEGFDEITGAAFDPEDKRIHVVDSGVHPGHQRIVMLDEQGRFLISWSLPVEKKLNTPMQIALSPDGQRAYATDLPGNRVIVLAVE